MTRRDGVKGSMNCRQCGGEMEKTTVGKFPGNMPWVLMGLGFFLSIFIFGPLVGLLVLLAGIYMVTAKETVIRCEDCGYYYRVLP